MCYLMDILIYYFSPISKSSHFMQSKSSEILSSNSLSILPGSQNPDLSPFHQKPLSSLRVAFGQWIRSLPMQERFVAIRIHVPQAATIIRRIFNRSDQPNSQSPRKQVGQHPLDSRQFSRKYQKIFYDSLVFVSDGHHYLDHVCFDYALLENPEKLFDLLISSSEVFSSLPLSELIKGSKDYQSLNQRLQRLTSREQISYQLFTFLREQIFINFGNSYKDNDCISKCLQEERKRKKELSNSWKYLPEQIKQRLLLLGHKDVENLCEWLNDHSIPVKLNEIEKETEELLKLEKNDFCNRIFKCKLKKILSPIVNYYELIYHQWKKELDRSRKKRGLKYNRSQRQFNSQQKSQYKESSKQHHRKHKKPRKSNSLESNDTNETERSKNYQEKNHSEEKQMQISFKQGISNDEAQLSSDHLQHKQAQNFSKSYQKQQTISGTGTDINLQAVEAPELYSTPKKPISICSTSTQLSSTKSQSQIQSQQQRPMQECFREACLSKLNEELQEISDKISEEANEFHDRRIIAFQRIQCLLPYIEIRLFGSCASGIAVRNSDIDIAIDNSILMHFKFLPETKRIQSALEWLHEVCQTQPWIVESKFIKTATIPLIKLTIDTSIPFFHTSIGEMYQLNRQHNCGIINADITVQTKNKSQQCSHLGLISTNAINQWLSHISSLHSIVIILKEFFARKRLNCTYEGGLNTFSMIVLMVAYIFHAKLEEEENVACVFERILRFYVQEFNEKQMGIDILNRQSNNIFYVKNLVNIQNSANKLGKQKADLQIKDPMNQQKNMTRNCYSFGQIRKLFKELLQNCFVRSYRELQDFAKTNEVNKQSKLSLEKTNRSAFANRNVFIQYLNTL